LQRRVGIIDSFDAGDWAFYALSENLCFDNYIGDPDEGGTLTPEKARIPFNLEFCELDIIVRTYGDVVGNYSIQATRKTASHIQSDEVIIVPEGELFTLPLTFTQDVQFNAATVNLIYDEELVEIIGINSDLPESQHHIHDDRVKFAWAGMASHTANQGDNLMVLELRTLAPVSETEVVFMLGDDTEFADQELKVLTNVGLSIPGIATTEDDDIVGIITPDLDDFALNVFPNPFRDELNIAFELGVTSDVTIRLMNAQGSRIAEFDKQSKESGRHEFTVSARNYSIEPGVYFVRMAVDDGSKVHYLVKRVVYMP